MTTIKVVLSIVGMAVVSTVFMMFVFYLLTGTAKAAVSVDMSLPPGMTGTLVTYGPSMSCSVSTATSGQPVTMITDNCQAALIGFLVVMDQSMPMDRTYTVDLTFQVVSMPMLKWHEQKLLVVPAGRVEGNIAMIGSSDAQITGVVVIGP